MLNYSTKCINTITLCITIIICIIFFIILDMFILNVPIQSNNENISVGKYISLKRGKIGNEAMTLEDTFLELMQKSDLYDENTRIEEIEKNDNTDEEINVEDNQNEFSFLDKENKWRIKIPKINVDAPINSGTTQAILATSVGHFEDMSLWNGNVGLAGHNRGYKCNFFQNIKYLNEGDEIIYCTEKGERKYKVVINKIIKQTDWSYLQETNDNRITLITCVENMYEYRRCIQGIEII